MGSLPTTAWSSGIPLTTWTSRPWPTTSTSRIWGSTHATESWCSHTRGSGRGTTAPSRSTSPRWRTVRGMCGGKSGRESLFSLPGDCVWVPRAADNIFLPSHLFVLSYSSLFQLMLMMLHHRCSMQHSNCASHQEGQVQASFFLAPSWGTCEFLLVPVQFSQSLIGCVWALTGLYACYYYISGEFLSCMCTPDTTAQFLHARMLSDYEVELSWQPPLGADSDILYYVVRVWWVKCSPPSISGKIKGLKERHEWFSLSGMKRQICGRMSQRHQWLLA